VLKNASSGSRSGSSIARSSKTTSKNLSKSKKEVPFKHSKIARKLAERRFLEVRVVLWVIRNKGKNAWKKDI